MSEAGAQLARDQLAGCVLRWLREWARSPPAQVMAALLALGTLLRLWHWLGGRSLWLDEAMLANSILARDWAGLMQPLDDMQLAPLGWLFVERAAFLFLGQSDFALRFPQMIAGIAALAIFAFTMRGVLGAVGSLVPIALFALSPELVRYSAEVKPYGFDALIAVVAISLAARHLLRDSALTRVDLAVLVTVGLAAIALSLPAAFALAGLGAALALREALRRRWSNLVVLAGVGAVWLSAFASLFLTVSHRDQAGTVDGMQQFWGYAFAPFPPTSLDDLRWYLDAALRLFNYAFGAPSLWIAGIVSVIGAVVVFRKAWLFAFALFAPAFCALAASMFHLYPFHDRLILFVLPALFVLIGFATDAILRIIGAKAMLAAGLLALLLLVGSLMTLWNAFTHYPAPFGSEDLRPALARLAERRDADEAVYVNRSALPAYRYYAAATGLNDAAVIEGRTMVAAASGCALVDLQRISSEPRVWVVYSRQEHFLELRAREDDLFIEVADAVGRRVHTIEHSNVRVYLYEFGVGASEQVAHVRRMLPVQSACTT